MVNLMGHVVVAMVLYVVQRVTWGSTVVPDYLQSGEYPDINDLFIPSYQNAPTIPNITGVKYYNISIDIKKISKKRLLKRFADYKNVLRDNDMKERRQGDDGDAHVQMKDELARGKAADLMLQAIYMARHKVKAVEDDPYAQIRDTPYRIGFIRRLFVRIFFKMHYIHDIMLANVAKYKTSVIMNLHARTMRLHYDGEYIIGLAYRLDWIFRNKNNIMLKLPKVYKTWKNGGITDDEKEIDKFGIIVRNNTKG